MARYPPHEPLGTAHRTTAYPHDVLERVQAGIVVQIPFADAYLHLCDSENDDAVRSLRMQTEPQPPTFLTRKIEELARWFPDIERKALRCGRRIMRESALLQIQVNSSYFTNLPATTSEWLRDQQAFIPLDLTAFGLPISAWSGSLTGAWTSGNGRSAPSFPILRWEKTRLTLVNGCAIPQTQFQELAACSILFVCTGNTCRSPLAEAMLKRFLAHRLGCAEAELPGRGWRINSAGLAAMPGFPASSGSQIAAERLGLRLADHRSRPLTFEALADADHIFAMTKGHAEVITSRYPEADARVELLSPQGVDIMDPYGREPIEYEACAVAMEAMVRQRLELFADELPPSPAKTTMPPAETAS